MSYQCNKCIATQGRSIDDCILIIEEILFNDKNKLITNWPFIKNNELLDSFTTLFEKRQNNQEDIDKKCSEIKDYFQNIVQKLQDKILIIEKRLLQNACNKTQSQLSEIYNQISKRAELKQYIQEGDLQSNNLKNFVRTQLLNQSQIEDILKQTCEAKEIFGQSQKERIDNQFNLILEKVNEVLILIDNDIDQKNINFDNLANSDIQILNIPENQLQKKIKTCMQNEGIKGYSYKVQDNTIIYQNEIYKSIGYINYELQQNDIGQSISFRIRLKSKLSIAVGILDASLVKKFDYSFNRSDKCGYLLFGDGEFCSFNDSKLTTDFIMENNDIIKMQIWNGSVQIFNKTKNKIFTFNYSFKPEQFFGFRLQSDSQIELL